MLLLQTAEYPCEWRNRFDDWSWRIRRTGGGKGVVGIDRVVVTTVEKKIETHSGRPSPVATNKSIGSGSRLLSLVFQGVPWGVVIEVYGVMLTATVMVNC